MVGRILVLCLLVVVVGVILAIATPRNVLVTPFRGMAISVLEVSSTIAGALSETRRSGADIEYDSVSKAIEEMKAAEGLADLSPTLTFSNDMSSFPGTEHPLFPGYLNDRYTRFEYCIAANGGLLLDVYGAQRGSLAWQIDQLLNRLKESQ